jgi:NAD(P)-dependent dehydrogenase (short-subunit alcohol dehydrogenase family)
VTSGTSMATNSRESRVAVVTGGARGLGMAITERLLSDGLKVAVFARNPTGGSGTNRDRLLILKVDVADPVQVRKGVAAVMRKFGRLDVLVNNAGVSGPIRPVQDISLQDWGRTLEVNLTGAFICCKYAIPHLSKSGSGGRVINISSMGWKKATAFRSPYSASKAGLVGFTRALSRELGRYRVTANVVSPGPIEGERIQEVAKGTAIANGVKPEDIRKRLLRASSLHRFSTSQEVAALVSFLVSEEGVSISGQDFNADST